MDHPSDHPVPLDSARSWRERVACAVAADLGAPNDPETITSARRIADRGVFGAGLALGALALLGGLAGWTATTELLRPADAPVHAPLLLAGTVLVPWLLLGGRALVVAVLRRQGSPLLGRLVPATLVRATGWMRASGDRPELIGATAGRIGTMLAAGSGRCLAAAGGGLFWTVFGLAAIATIWLSTARVAYGFGWESSWLSPELGRGVTHGLATPLGVVPGAPDLDALVPVAAPPTAAADDPVALERRRAWITFLTFGIGIYLVLPLGLWTVLNAAVGHGRAERWRPRTVGPPRPTRRRAATATPPPPMSPPGVAASPVTHRVQIERPAAASMSSAALLELEDLGHLEVESDLKTAAAAIGRPETRIAIVAWLPATPDRGVRRRLRTLVDAAAHPPLLVLDGGDRLRRAEPAATVAARLDDWRTLAADLGIEPLEIDLAQATDRSRTDLADRLAGRPSPESGERPLDPASLDAAFATIGRHLEDEGPDLTDDAGLAACLTEIARVFEADAIDGVGLRAIDWKRALGRLGTIDPESAADRLDAVRSLGLDLLPASLRRGAVWAGVGGLLGVATCAAAATVAPAVLLAIPGWAGTGAGLAGLLSLVRRASGNAEVGSDPSGFRPLGEAVFAAAASAVLWWTQAGDESRTERTLDALAEGETPPALEDADAARRWLALARDRAIAAAGVDA